MTFSRLTTGGCSSRGSVSMWRSTPSTRCRTLTTSLLGLEVQVAGAGADGVLDERVDQAHDRRRPRRPRRRRGG